jgi:hypothetical protein
MPAARPAMEVREENTGIEVSVAEEPEPLR